MKTKDTKPLVDLSTRIREDQKAKLVARAKKEKKGQGELIRELLDRHL